MGYKRAIGFTTVITSSLFWLTTQVFRTRHSINNAIDTSIFEVIDHHEKIRCDDDEYQFVNWIKRKEAKLRSPINALWLNCKFSLARRLLGLANHENPAVRSQAIAHLAQFKSLEDWHYALLANICDAETAVSLARMADVDLRFFAQPQSKLYTNNNQLLIYAMKDYMTFLSTRSHHGCIENFVSQAFSEDYDMGYYYDIDPSLGEMPKVLKGSPELLPICLQSILHHSTIDLYAGDILMHNGLNLLMEVYQKMKSNRDVDIIVCNILANVSIHKNALDEFHTSSWIGLLSQWSRDANIRLSIPAARALANLDRHEAFKSQYGRNVYLLHPTLGRRDAVTTNVAGNTDLDVVFVHGLLGGALYTWRQRDRDDSIGLMGKKRGCVGQSESLTTEHNESRLLRSSDPNVREYAQEMHELKSTEYDSIGAGYEHVSYDLPEYSEAGDEDSGMCSDANATSCFTQCWPRDWLPRDCARIRVLGVNYDTALSSVWFSTNCPHSAKRSQRKNSEEVSDLDERSSALMDQLIDAGIGKRPVVFVCHSMGGLLVKNMLHQAYYSSHPYENNFATNTKGIVFYSTPHRGSSIANFYAPTSLIVMPSLTVRELREGSEKLKEIHKNFMNLVQVLPIEIISFVETKPTVVSAMKITLTLVSNHSANIGVGEYYEIPLDHLGICKPYNRQSFLYQRVVRLINDVLDQCSEPKTEPDVSLFFSHI